MASLSEIYIKIETLETLLKTVKSKGEKGLSITISMNDEMNNYNQNVAAFVSQDKAARDAKKPKYYVGNGRTFWSNGDISVISKNGDDFVINRVGDAAPAPVEASNDDAVDDFPF